MCCVCAVRACALRWPPANPSSRLCSMHARHLPCRAWQRLCLLLRSAYVELDRSASCRVPQANCYAAFPSNRFASVRVQFRAEKRLNTISLDIYREKIAMPSFPIAAHHFKIDIFCILSAASSAVYTQQIRSWHIFSPLFCALIRTRFAPELFVRNGKMRWWISFI